MQALQHPQPAKELYPLLPQRMFRKPFFVLWFSGLAKRARKSLATIEGEKKFTCLNQLNCRG